MAVEFVFAAVAAGGGRIFDGLRDAAVEAFHHAIGLRLKGAGELVLEALGVTTAYYGRNQQPGVTRRYYSSLIEMARDADVLIVCAPGGKETGNIVDAAVLQALGPNGILINVARGSLVDEQALIAALKNGTILAAGLDVFAAEPRVPPELLALENTVLLPHVGSASHLTRNAMGQLVADNLISWFDGKGPITPVPETPYPRQPAGV